MKDRLASDEDFRDELDAVVLELYEYLIDRGHLEKGNLTVTYNSLVRLVCMLTAVTDVTDSELTSLMTSYLSSYRESQKKMTELLDKEKESSTLN